MWLSKIQVFWIILLVNPRVTLQEDESSFAESEKSTVRRKRLILKDPNSLWPGGVVPYIFHDNQDAASIREIKVAMSVYHQYTPIRFELKTDQTARKLGHTSYANFTNEGIRVCYARLGREDTVGQPISCCRRRTCIHEIGHMLGFAHEIAHPDRNKWVRMNWNTFRKDFQSPFWQERDETRFHTSPYDLSSFMHYIPHIYRTGPRFTLSFSELSVNKTIFYMFKELCHVYKCHELGQCKTTNLKCDNEGYVSVVANKCSCVCLPGFDPNNGCSKLLNAVSKDKLPRGQYALLESGQGCPDGMTRHTLVVREGGNMANGLDICQHQGTPSDCKDGDCGWPRGTYCFLAMSSCPQNKDIRQATFTYNNMNSVTRSEIKFCCLENDIPRNPVNFDPKTSFSLVMHHEKSCQQFIGMRVEERAITFDAKTTNSITDGPFKETDGTTLSIFACDYTPVDMNCGGIVELNNVKRTTTIENDSRSPSNKDCKWLIKGPSTEKGALILNFEKFENVRKLNGRCVDSVEVNHVRMGQSGIRYCGEPVKHSIRSVYNNMTIRLQTGGESMANFKAKVTWVPASDWCYRLSDNGMSYGGDVNYTRRFQPCLPWKEVSRCFHNAYSGSDAFPLLEGNACRNPDNSFRPWCYTHVEPSYPRARTVTCKRDFCDVCHLETAYDQKDNCDVCTGDPGVDIKHCAKTCGSHTRSDAKKVSGIVCPKPGPAVSNGRQLTEQESYSVGDTVVYRCVRNKHFTIERVCLSTGKWSAANTACTECPSGFSYNNGNCYKFVDKWLTYQLAAVECRSLGAWLTSVTSQAENDFLDKLRPDGTPFMWLGGRWMQDNGKFIWEDGSPVSLMKWNRGITRSELDENSYILMQPFKGRWDIDPKKKALPFVCKMTSAADADCTDVYDNCQDLIVSDSCKTSFKLRNFCRKSCGFCSA